MTNHAKTILIYDDAESMTSAGPLGARLAESFRLDPVAIVKADRHNFVKAIEELQPAIIILPEILGEQSFYNDHLTEHGKYAIRTAVSHGAMFIGFCAGAYFACSDIVYAPGWGNRKERKQDSTLGLFNATALGPLPAHGRPSNGKADLGGCVPVDVHTFHEGGIRPETVWYGNGPVFIPQDSFLPQNSEILATYIKTGLSELAALAACKIPYGQGSVIACGVLPHYKNEPADRNNMLWKTMTEKMAKHLFAFKPAGMVPRFL